MARTAVKIVFNKIPDIVKRMKPAAMEIIGETLEDIDATVKTGMAASGSPSSPGQMPGIDTGALVNSLQSELNPSKYQGTYYTNMEYAEYLEVGTTRMLARPFMTPAAERNRAKFMARMGELEGRLE